MGAPASRHASHLASRLAVSISGSHLHCLSFSALIGFLVLTHTPGPVFDPGDRFSHSLGFQLPSLTGAAGGGGGTACATLMFRALCGQGHPPQSQEAAHGSQDGDGDCQTLSREMDFLSGPSVSLRNQWPWWSRTAHLEDTGCLSPGINGTLIFLHASGCAWSRRLLLAGPPEKGPRAGLNCPWPTGPAGRAGQWKGHRMTGAFLHWAFDRRPRVPSPCQTCSPKDPKGVPVRSLSQEMVTDKLRASTPPRDGGISGQQCFVCPVPSSCVEYLDVWLNFHFSDRCLRLLAL